MSRFTPQEIEYLKGQRIGRLATVNARGDPHVVPVGFRYNPETDTIDIGGRSLSATKKWRDVRQSGKAALVVDDVRPPWQTRLVEIRGTVETFPEGGEVIGQGFGPEMLRITPTYIVSFGLEEAPSSGERTRQERRAGVMGRKVA